ncbi:MAG: TetR/AcrR family transcriptional regulator, partial [Chitinophagaceae bacterium]|nr:TetR/AcrR family transcriptional regulator [Chitinophagaceae bacterium]
MKPKDDKKIEDIYSATLQLVKDYGLSGITMSMIARQANLATGTVYLYFTNKEELIAKLFDVCANNYIQVYYKGVNDADEFEKSFKTIWMNLINFNIKYFDQIIFLEQCFHS